MNFSTESLLAAQEQAPARRLRVAWNIGLVAAGGLLFALAFARMPSLAVGGAWRFLAIGLMAFVAEYVDSSLGMGYGTTLTPLLMILGFSPLQIVPAVLMSEFFTGISAGLMHHGFGNVDLRRGTRAFTTTWILSLCSVVGALLAVVLAVNLPKQAVKLYIGVMVLAVGLFIVIAGKGIGRFSWGKIIGLGTVAAFNKGISGGGYGPLLTGGQVLAGVPGKNAIGITSLAEGVVCLVGLIAYFTLRQSLDWGLAVPLVVGAMASVPAATWTVKVLPESILRRSIGYATTYLGILSLVSSLKT